jgi:hypothetical protein
VVGGGESFGGYWYDEEWTKVGVKCMERSRSMAYVRGEKAWKILLHVTAYSASDTQ